MLFLYGSLSGERNEEGEWEEREVCGRRGGRGKKGRGNIA